MINEQAEISVEPRAGAEVSLGPVPPERILTKARRKLAGIFKTKPDNEYPIPPKTIGMQKSY